MGIPLEEFLGEEGQGELHVASSISSFHVFYIRAAIPEIDRSCVSDNEIKARDGCCSRTRSALCSVAPSKGEDQDGGAAPHDDGEALSVQLGPSHAYAVEREEGEKEEQ